MKSALCLCSASLIMSEYMPQPPSMSMALRGTSRGRSVGCTLVYLIPGESGQELASTSPILEQMISCLPISSVCDAISPALACELHSSCESSLAKL